MEHKIQVAEYLFRLKYGVPPNTLLLNHTDYWLLVEQHKLIVPMTTGILTFMGMEIITSSQIKEPRVALTQTMQDQE